MIRRYRLEIPSNAWGTTTYENEASARKAIKRLPNDCRWRLTLRAERGRKTTLIEEGRVGPLPWQRPHDIGTQEPAVNVKDEVKS